MLEIIYFVFVFICQKSYAIEIIWDNNAITDWNDVDFGRADVVRMPNWFFIFPGTKWCGAGDIAEDRDDLGEFRDTDKCCRQHDYCSDVIAGHQSKYNLTNPSFYSRLSCDCDNEFHRCLLSVNSAISIQVGAIYFNALGTQCFREEHPIIRCRKYAYVPIRKCTDYEVDKTEDKLYQWFDVPPY